MSIFRSQSGNSHSALSPSFQVEQGGRDGSTCNVREEMRLQPARPRLMASSQDEARLNAFLDACADGVVVVNLDGTVAEANQAGLDIFDAASISELSARAITEFIAPEYRNSFEVCVQALHRGEKGYAEFESAGRDDCRRWVEMHASPLLDHEGAVTSFLGILRDNTARRELNKQFIQAQKVEVLGQLAGGVAHDFNNMLGIIMGYTEMLMDGLGAGSRQQSDAQAVFHTAQRAAALTHQLLIFSRKQTPVAQIIDLSEVIVSVDPMLRRLLRENINLITVPEPSLARVKADPCQLEQVLMNLTINARDAMSAGGVIIIETANAIVEKDSETHPGVPPGHYALLSVKDTGAGMSEEVRLKIFDAFFTTKPAGQGTGLGLATCQSIVRHWGGHLTVESGLGVGTIFRVYLPRAAAAVAADPDAAEETAPPRGTETVLLVEDEPGLLALTTTVLQRQGYTVLKAANGREALSIVHQRRSNDISIVMTDMVMPEMGGRMIADWLHAINPAMKILFTSGYTDCGQGSAIDAEMDFIPKPYTPSALLRKMREVIDRRTLNGKL